MLQWTKEHDGGYIFYYARCGKLNFMVSADHRGGAVLSIDVSGLLGDIDHTYKGNVSAAKRAAQRIVDSITKGERSCQ